MKQVFVDTNAWIALNSKRDRLHDKAVEVNKNLLRTGNRYLTTNFVLDEAYMRQLKLTEAFTNDHHFTQMGFVTLLKA